MERVLLSIQVAAGKEKTDIELKVIDSKIQAPKLPKARNRGGKKRKKKKTKKSF